jgi:hypothetical protein
VRHIKVSAWQFLDYPASTSSVNSAVIVEGARSATSALRQQKTLPSISQVGQQPEQVTYFFAAMAMAFPEWETASDYASRAR